MNRAATLFVGNAVKRWRRQVAPWIPLHDMEQNRSQSPMQSWFEIT